MSNVLGEGFILAYGFRSFSWLVVVGPVVRQGMVGSACRKRAVHLMAARKGQKGQESK